MACACSWYPFITSNHCRLHLGKQNGQRTSAFIIVSIKVFPLGIQCRTSLDWDLQKLRMCGLWRPIPHWWHSETYRNKYHFATKVITLYYHIFDGNIIRWKWCSAIFQPRQWYLIEFHRFIMKASVSTIRCWSAFEPPELSEWMPMERNTMYEHPRLTWLPTSGRWS
jgi:hypothetical protein